ncbi:single-stranded DNA-binding protein [Frateuria sp.]|uniref:single-stranded DNA-binding protein n=1 Tax=Frateuria sp. TaxID=2211372 RepID=UPI003F7E93E1
MSINFSDVVRIGKDAVTRFTGAGKAVTGFSAAVDSGYGDKKQTIWLDCSAWGERYEKVAPYLTKGSQVFIQGELGTREHEGKTYITVDVKDLKLVGGKPAGESKPQRQERAPRQSAPAPAGDDPYGDDVPFRQFRHHSYF